MANLKGISAKRSDLFRVNPKDLVVIGIDTEHKSRIDHPLWDERVYIPLEEATTLNIAYHNVIEPIVVRPDGDAYEVVDGRRRTLHARKANEIRTAQGLDALEVPIIVKRGDVRDLIGVSVSLNEIRRSDEILTRAAKASYMVEIGKSREEVARDFGVTVQAIGQWLRINDLAPEVKSAIEEGKISASAAVALHKLKREEQGAALQEILAPASSIGTPDGGYTFNLPDDHTDTGVYAEEPSKSTEEALAAPKRATVNEVKAKVQGKEQGLTKGEIKRLIADFDQDRNKIPGDFVNMLRVITGELKPNTIKGLEAALTKLRAK